MQLSLTVNGQPHQIETDPRTLLLTVLREDLGLRGTKYGCGEGECGACTVILNGQVVNACLTTAGQAHKAEILTIEGMATDQIGASVLNSFTKAGSVQCGFCTPGFVVSARALLQETHSPDTETIQRRLSGNFCRCTGYTKIIQAVAQAGEAIQASQTDSTKPSNQLSDIQSNGQGQFAPANESK